MTNLQHEDEQKIETTLGGLKAVFTKWSRDMREDREAFASDEYMNTLSPEEDGKMTAEYFMLLLNSAEEKPAMPKAVPS